MKYKTVEDSGYTRTVEASSLEEALEIAKEKAKEGWYDQRLSVQVWAYELDENEQRAGASLFAHVPVGPIPTRKKCGDEDEDHDWQSPIELVGGCTHNPGVFSTAGTRFDCFEVCGRCGMYKHSWALGRQRNPGDLPEGVEYTDADERSLAWVAEQE
jgi:hypothetical protein